MALSILSKVWVQFVNLAILFATLYLIIFQVRPLAIETLPGHFFIPLVFTYIFAAYVIAPISVRVAGMISGRRKIPRYTYSVDGLPTDPVNIVVIGSHTGLMKIYRDAKWSTADKISISSSLHMATSFIANKPYHTAPFSNLYLFGRKQDIGFQVSINNSPRKRHHVRYWALDSTPEDIGMLNRILWHGKVLTDIETAQIWVGSATKDIGLGLTPGTFKISHSLHIDTVAERNFMVNELKKQVWSNA